MSSIEKDSQSAFVIAIPVAGGQLCMHFGHCEQFALLDVDTASKQILGVKKKNKDEEKSTGSKGTYEPTG